MKKQAKEKTVYIPFRLDSETDRLLCAAASAAHQTKSEIVRSLIDKGLKADGYRKDDERLYQMIRQAVGEITKPQVERLASISAKATQIDSAAFFLLVYIGRLVLPPEHAQIIDEAAARARKLGIEYLKHPGLDVEDFIRHGIEKIKDE